MIWQCSATVTCANDELIRLNKFVSWFTDGFCNFIFLLVSKHFIRHPYIIWCDILKLYMLNLNEAWVVQIELHSTMCALHALRICRGMPAAPHGARSTEIWRGPRPLQCRARRSPGRPGSLGKLSRAPPARRQGCHCHYLQPCVLEEDFGCRHPRRCGNERGTPMICFYFQPLHRLLHRSWGIYTNSSHTASMLPRDQVLDVWGIFLFSCMFMCV